MNQDPLPENSKRNFVLLSMYIVMQRDVERFGCELFAKRNYNVKLVSCWNVFHKKNYKEFEVGKYRNVSQAILPSSREELEAFLDTLSTTDFILMRVPLLLETFWLYLELSKRSLRYSYTSLGAIPTTFVCRLSSLPAFSNCLQSLFKNIYQFAARLVERVRLVKALGFSYFKLKGPLYFIRSGVFKKQFSVPIPFLWRSNVIDVESFDMGWVRRIENKEFNSLNYKYAVYLDDAGGSHPDWDILGGRPENLNIIYAIPHSLFKNSNSTHIVSEFIWRK